MPGFLKQSTNSQSRGIGPFIDDTDFKTAKTGLTIANTDVKLSANGAASFNKTSGGGTHRINGIYSFTFDSTDTATVGQLSVSIAVSSALVVWDYFTVLEEAVYDAIFGASAALAMTLASGAITTSTFAAGAINAAAIADDAIDAGAIATDAIGSNEISSAAANKIADALLNRDMSAVSDTTARSPLNALRALRNKVSISGTTMTVCEEDDTTSAWTATLTAAPGADPISAIDP